MGFFKMQGGAQRLGMDPGDPSGGFVPVAFSYGGSSMNTGQVTCASAVAATLIVAANPSRLAVTLYHNENGNLWLSNTSASTTASSAGGILKGQTSLTLHTQAAIYGLASSGTTAKTAYVEEAL